MKLFITGGHVTPAIAVTGEIQKRHPEWEIVFVGRMYAMEGDRRQSAEYRQVRDLGIRFLPVATGRIQRSFTRYTIPSFFKIFSGFFQAISSIQKEKPAIILSFGGYVAAPIVLAGWLHGIPSITHEQTRVRGLANRFIGFFAKRICVSYRDTVTLFPKEKTVYTGLPIRKEIFTPPKKALFSISASYPLIYVAGGATGSTSVNALISPILPELLEKYTVVHQTGYGHLQGSTEHSRYHVLPYVSASDLSWIYKHMSIYIGRSGGNTVGELAAVGKPALFIPLPWAGGNEQYRNAQLLEKAGSAIIVNQNKITPGELLRATVHVLQSYDTFYARAREFAKTFPRDGASNVVDVIEDLVS